MSTPSFPNALQRWRLQWQHRPAHERRLLGILAALVLAALFWLAIWYPMRQHLTAMTQSLPVARAALDEARQQWAESSGRPSSATSASSSANTPATADLRTAIERAVARFNLNAAITALDVQGDDVSITLSALPFDTLVQLIDHWQRDEHLYLTHVQLTPLAATAQPAEPRNRQVRAELTLRRPSL